MSSKKIQPVMVFADEDGNIYDHPDLLMLVRRGRELTLPRPDELIPLPEGSDLYLLPGRHALGLDPQTGKAEALEERAVAAFVCPSYTLSATAAYLKDEGSPNLPLFAYGAVGFANDRFWVAATQVDKDRRQVFTQVAPERITKGAQDLLRRYPENRLIGHLARCALTFCCPAAKNLALGRFEAPLPTSKACNARCYGCISHQPLESGFPASQNRIDFRPKAREIVEIMHLHSKRAKNPVLSFGQGCEGEPLTEASLLTEAVAIFRSEGGRGTVNINTNASLPDTIPDLAKAGLDSIRVSMNSARETVYNSYYRPHGYTFADVCRTIATAREHELFISINYLFFPGINDTESELAALTDLVTQTRPNYIQMRNLSLDPELYLGCVGEPTESSMGLGNFMKRLKKACPWINYGYFNPYLEGRSPLLWT
ncbi:MAG: radical SAM protein [Desulfomicrobium sp.]|nr:radical SAM protein [Pseudomonadota bacterium]MBV1712491.1 radical SAM protein [Desulfomicrobium sp.]MBU4571203.1 radical SAM protein [Pseudomonadota bacterium]MBU4592940.1 radical SAM protein [Pseudomonadota bacterium]MBV1720562.1 radical SAM protein [Desulfomicrobium sp.]